ncbi:hypothetical protein SEUCBS139899_006522 [Sporothrix eucalyptigena]|uniref:Ketoreductase domain-containing protein n=1 Tax=Sporothrix eucalyptigena TaxID=1812306 RepID=A0ABP0B7W6_9PEZI
MSVVIVTGASRGIGLAVTRHLLTHSHKAVLVSRAEAPLAALKKEFPGQVAYLAADATDYTALGKVVDLAVSTFGRVDGLVINHGVLTPVQRLADADLDAWKRLYDINVFSALAIAKAAIPELRKTSGRIVIISSGASLKGYASWGAYGSSKAAANSLVQHLAVEEPAITSVAVAPGRVDTDMQKDIREQGVLGGMDPKVYATFVDAFEAGELNPPEKPSEVIAKLALEAKHELSGKYVNWNDVNMAPYHWD